MRVLVTGASGHVGGAIAAHLICAGLQVVGLSRKPAPLTSIEAARYDISSAGISKDIARRVQCCEAIIHAAASLEKELWAPSIALTNCLGTQEMLKLASLWGTKQFIYISSVPIIGLPQQHPITEDHPTAPPTAYHASKLFGEHLVRLAERDGILGVSLRITSPIGPGMPANRILPVFIRQALAGKSIQLNGSGTRRQDYVDVRDIALAVEQCLTARVHGLFNVASGRAVSNEELARACAALLQSKSLVEFSGKDDPEEGVSWEVSIQRARAGFAYEPKCALENSIQAVAKEYASSHY